MNRPIALFDSGVGGLTVLQSVMEVLPNESYVYLADNAFFPYGIKSYHELDERVTTITKYLVSLGVKAIVVACNTASLHIETIKKIANVPVVDVIIPTCNKVVGLTKSKRVCLLATDATVHSQRYQQVLKNSGVDVVPVPCSSFVPLAENYGCEQYLIGDVVRQKLASVVEGNFDTVILGCTHFGIIKQWIATILGNKLYVECGAPTALHLREVLLNNNLLSNDGSCQLKVITTAKCDIDTKISSSFLHNLSSVHVEHL